MRDGLDDSRRSELLAIIRQVRRRWRTKVALRGAALALSAGLLTLALSAFALEALRFSPGAILTFRFVFVAALLLLAWRFLARPLLRRVTDEQIALYLEEHEPSLEAALVSAVEAARMPDAAPAPERSLALVHRLVESAIEQCQTLDAARAPEQAALRRYALAIAGAILVGVAALLFGPQFLRHGASALLLLSRSVQAAAPYRIEVKPGDARVPRGADQTITARLFGFESDRVELVWKKAPGASFERLPLVPGDSGAFEGMLFDLAEPVEYFVEASGVRSAVFALKTVDLPYVQRLELELHFPAYTGLPPRTIEDGGDLAVLRGTEVRLRAIPTMAAPGGRVLVNDAPVALTAEQDRTLSGRFTVDRDGFYRIELDGPDGARVAASPQYTIDALADQAPSVWIEKPRRDTTAAPLDEVFVEARADDDFGVRDLQLVYSVNGGPETTLKLFGGARPLSEISAGHTFYLEELRVEPGDFVSYYARATDNDRVQGPKSVVSDLYFMRIRPFNKEFKPAPSQAGGGGAGGGEVGALSEQQRQIIAATFNVVRDRKTYSADKFRENVVFLTLAQARLREQIDELVTRLNSRLVEPDPSFKKIAELLPQAAREMRAAEAKLQARKPDEALQPEQRALQFLQKAEEEYELQVTVGRNQSGGGGGSSALAEDLADLFELELDKLANQYETMQRAEQESADRRLDELAEKLQELARRQQQEAERQRRWAASGQAGGQAGAGQRALAEQAEEAARRLERLAREQSRPDLADAARRLQEAADAMRRAAASRDANGAGEAGAALERLRDAQRRLEGGKAARAERDIQDARRKAAELAEAQREIAGDVQELARSGAPQKDRVGRLAERKDTLESGVKDLEKRLDESALAMRRDERDASRKLQEAANAIRDKKIKEKIRYSKGLLQAGSAEHAQSFEQDIGANLDALTRKLGEAAASLGTPNGDPTAEALDKARDLARGLESLGERMRERAERGASAQQSGRETAGKGETAGSESEGGGQQGQQGGQDARGGQQGGQGARGGERASGQSADGRGGEGDTVGPWGPGGGYGSRRPGAFTGEDIRQFRGEVRQWSSDAQELRRRLRQQGVEAGDLDEILRALRALDSERVYKDVAELERLQTFVVEGMKRFEYALQRKLAANAEGVVLSGSDEVPPGFRPLVEEYYRQLSRRSPR